MTRTVAVDSASKEAPASTGVVRSRPLPLQGSLRIGRTDDPLEHEADRVAREVLRAPGGTLRRCACGGSPGSDGECAACKAKRLGLRRASAGALSETIAPPIVHEVLASPGRPLDLRSRAFFEPRLGLDLGDVRVHDDARAASSSNAVGALAYTVGDDIAFDTGRCAPGTSTGDRLLAHELAHVAHQRAAAVSTAPPALMRAMPAGAEAEIEQVHEEALEPIRSATEASAEVFVGPVRPEDVERAIANLQVVRQILTDVHGDLNTVLIMLQNLEEMQLPAVYTVDFFVDLLTEGGEALAIAAGESTEAAAAFAVFVVKMVAQTAERHYKTRVRNEALEDRNLTIEFLLEQMTLTRTHIDELISAVPAVPGLAIELAGMTVPEVPGRVSAEISGRLEFLLIKSAIKQNGGVLALRRTDQLRVDTTSATYEDTEHYRVARELHDDPGANWYLDSLPQPSPASVAPIGTTFFYHWRILLVEGVAEEVVSHALRRMKARSIPKKELYHRGAPSDVPINVKSEDIFQWVSVPVSAPAPPPLLPAPGRPFE